MKFSKEEEKVPKEEEEVGEDQFYTNDDLELKSQNKA